MPASLSVMDILGQCARSLSRVCVRARACVRAIRDVCVCVRARSEMCVCARARVHDQRWATYVVLLSQIGLIEKQAHQYIYA